jgi:hypothetical protein
LWLSPPSWKPVIPWLCIFLFDFLPSFFHVLRIFVGTLGLPR